ncbi:histidine phosphatase family protein [Actinospica robiniae]|uniref:histidine phosphatase family protein n=1 Tax=Actinospica robiniae TaxID=304901 RepID=UPI00040D20D0|nr:histidine phosphatase family protein [Actinospica robiniae]
MGEIILLRHGETAWSRDGRHTGRTDLPLTDEGRRQAKAAGALLGELPAGTPCWTSPAQRAVETAKLAGLEPDGTDPDLWEWDYGGYEGITSAQIQTQRPGWFLWRDGVVPGGPAGFPGETVEQVGERCDRVIARVLPLAAEGDVVLVAHGHLLRILSARWIEQPPVHGSRLKLDTASVSRLGFEHEIRVITGWNQVG